MDDDSDAPQKHRLPREDLRAIAGHQKALIRCVLVYLCTIPVQCIIPANPQLVSGYALLSLGLTATVFVFRLATMLYSPGMGVMLGILTAIPCFGLIVMLTVNGDATIILKSHGIRVGFLGAKASDI